MHLTKSVFWSVAAFLTFASSSPSHAQAPAEFFKGKSIDLYIGTSIGGAYDAYARLISRHMSKYVPGNPTIVPKNLEGAGGLRLANFLFNAAPKDGTALGTILRGAAFDPLLGNSAAQFDATKFNWIGSTNNEVSVCVAWHTTGVTKLEQVLTQELVVGATGPTADTYQFPKTVNGVFGTKFKIVTGYPGGNDVDLAMERGEVQGRCGWSWTSLKGIHQAWLDQKKVNILFQIGLSKHPDLPDVPLAVDLARTDDDRAIMKLVFARQTIAWPYVAPPGVPNDRVEALRRAFADTMRDPEFLAEAEKARLEVRPVSGEEIQNLIEDVYRTPEPVVRRTAEMMR